MEFYNLILTVAAISAVGIVSPGPDFMAVSYTAMTSSRKKAGVVALGVVLGNAIWAGAALLGVGALFALFPALFVIIKVGGGLYLCWLGAQMLLHARKPLPSSDEVKNSTFLSSFTKGFSTTMANPKAVAFYASMLSSAAPNSAGFIEFSAMISAVIAVAALWFSFVILVLSTPLAARLFRRLKVYFESLFGILLISFGIRQILTR